MVDKRENEKKLVEARHNLGLYSIQELCSMFGCGRTKIDLAINTGQLKYISPNNRDRFVYLKDFFDFLNYKSEVKNEKI